MPELHELLRYGGRDSECSVIRALMIRNSNQADLAKLCGLSSASIASALKDLERRKFVRRTEEGREKLSRLERVDGVAVGVELGYQRSAVVARRIDSADRVPVRETLGVGATHGSRVWTEAIVGSIRGVTQELGEPFDDVATLGMGIPRIVDPKSGRLTPPVLPPWANAADPAKSLEDALRAGAPDASARAHVQVKLDNDATLGALAESVETFLGAEILLFVKASTGVGAGLVVGGHVIRGALGIAGELGHVMVDDRGRYCRCGGRGCLETVIGADALLQNVKAAFGKAHPGVPNNLDELVKRAGDGDQLCDRVLREAAIALGKALGSVCNLLNPSVIVLGGGLAAAGDLIIGTCLESIRRTALAAVFAEPDAFKLRISGLDHPVARGALILGIQGAEGRQG